MYSLVEQLACCVKTLSNYADPFISPLYGATGGRPALSQVMSLLGGFTCRDEVPCEAEACHCSEERRHCSVWRARPLF